MAEGLFNTRAPAGWRAGSAGTDPGDAVRPEAIAAMREIGIDISRQTPKSLAVAIGQGAPELVVGLCAEEACPVVPGARSLHWPLANPAGAGVELYRAVREELASRIVALVAELSGAPDAARARQSAGGETA
jgi:arsenate reductase